jgi:formate hydrogenlyase subunit 3/multisubunit Na+/H+ antiporter MnhD subunit
MDEHCDGCGQKDRCQEVYEKLGRREGPNIALKAVTAFVVPVAVFVAAALLIQNLLKNKIENASLIVLIQLATGLAAAGLIVFMIRRFTRRSGFGPVNCPEKEKH